MTSATATIELKDKLTDNFRKLEDRLNGHKASKLHHSRQQAMKRFEEVGLPTTKNEEWKYTNLKPLQEITFHPAFEFDRDNLQESDIQQFYLTQEKVHRLVFVNGRFCEVFSTIEEDDAIEVTDLSSYFKKEPDNAAVLLEKTLQRKDADAFALLNTANNVDGSHIKIKANKQAKMPVHLLYIQTGGDVIAHPRNIVEAERGSSATIIETYHSLGDTAAFTNRVAHIEVAENASLNYYRLLLENESSFHISSNYVNQKNDSTFKMVLVNIGGRLNRNNSEFKLDGSNCNTYFNGLALTHKKQHADVRTFMNHAQPHSFSSQLFKTLLAGRSSAVFNGKILVDQAAQQTNAYQSNKNILLSDTAVINSKPQLEIYADDVKCSHGATTGQMDEDAVFYLRARAISEEDARKMLNFSFADEVIETINIKELREKVAAAIEEKLNVIG